MESDLEEIKVIGKGRYGTVVLAERKNSLVAVKVFNSSDESFWMREKDIFEINLLRHRNVVGEILLYGSLFI